MGNTEIRLNPDKVQAIITDLTNFRNQKGWSSYNESY